MKKIILGLSIVVSLFFVHSVSFSAETIQPGPGKTQLMVRDGVPKGVSIKNRKVTAQPGYIFEKVSKNRAVSRIRGGGLGTTGNFDCTCNGNDGGCDIVTTPNSVTCAQGSCKSSCYMIITIPGGPAPSVLR